MHLLVRCRVPPETEHPAIGESASRRQFTITNVEIYPGSGMQYGRVILGDDGFGVPVNTG